MCCVRTAAPRQAVGEMGGAGGAAPSSGAAMDGEGKKDCLDYVVCMETKKRRLFFFSRANTSVCVKDVIVLCVQGVLHLSLTGA